VKTAVYFFPFDLFGSAGTGEGVALLAEAFREMLEDNRREKAPTRARSYTKNLVLKEFQFETLNEYEGWQDQARAAVGPSLSQGQFLIWVTGNHLGSLPVYEELAKRKDSSLVLQFDAHLDIHHFDECSKEPSHGNFLMHVKGPMPTLINVGHRELLLPANHIRKFYQTAFSSDQLMADTEACMVYLQEAVLSADRILIDIDCDVFDPAFFPGVTHPMPFGLSPAQVLQAINAVWSDKIAGICLSEFNPAGDRGDMSLTTLLWLLEYLLIKKHE
jgi:arginase family enzyme